MLYIALALIIFLAGCVDSGRTKTEIISKDMLKIKSIDLFPSKDLQPEDTLVIRMEVENLGQESTYLLVDKNSNVISNKNPDWNGDYLLIDHCSSLYNANTDTELKDAEFQILSGGTCITITPSTPLVKDSSGKEISGTACYLNIPPGQSHTFQWSMKAPSSKKIADMTQKCTFKFQIAYAAKAVTNTYVYFADPIEVAQRMYTQKEMSLAGDNIASYGPIAVNFVPAEPQPIPAKADGKWTVFLNVKNVGTGLANVDALNLGIPQGVSSVDCIWINEPLSISRKVQLLWMIQQASGYKDTMTVEEGLQNWDTICPELYSDRPDLIATECNKAILCTDNPSFCSANAKDLKGKLEDAANMLKIYSGTTSRLPCELTIPEGVTILSPFRFVTTADYTYSIRQDIPITTKPVRERA